MQSTLRSTHLHSGRTWIPRGPSRKEELALGMLDLEDVLEVMRMSDALVETPGSRECKRSGWELVGKAGRRLPDTGRGSNTFSFELLQTRDSKPCGVF